MYQSIQKKKKKEKNHSLWNNKKLIIKLKKKKKVKLILGVFWRNYWMEGRENMKPLLILQHII